MRATFIPMCAALLLTVMAEPSSAAREPEPKVFDEATVAAVKTVLARPIDELPPAAIEGFLKVDPESLPWRLKRPYKAKRLELYTLLQLAEGKKKGHIRMPDKDCSPPPDSKSADVSVLRFGGFWAEIKEEEEEFLLQKTGCTEQELMCEFSLQIALEKNPPKRRPPRRYYFIAPKDPLMAYVAEYRSGIKHGQTKFFGLGGPSCPK